MTPPGPRSVQGARHAGLLAMAPGLVGQTTERAGGYKKDAGRICRRQASAAELWITV